MGLLGPSHWRIDYIASGLALPPSVDGLWAPKLVFHFGNWGLGFRAWLVG